MSGKYHEATIQGIIAECKEHVIEKVQQAYAYSQRKGSLRGKRMSWIYSALQNCRDLIAVIIKRLLLNKTRTTAQAVLSPLKNTANVTELDINKQQFAKIKKGILKN